MVIRLFNLGSSPQPAYHIDASHRNTTNISKYKYYYALKEVLYLSPRRKPIDNADPVPKTAPAATSVG